MTKIHNFIIFFVVSIFISSTPLLSFAEEPIDTLPLDGNPYNSFLIGTSLYVLSKKASRMYIVNTTLNKVTKTITLDNGPTTAFISNGKIYVANSEDKTVQVYYSSTAGYKTKTTVGVGPIALTGSDSRVYVINFDDSISVIDSSADSVLKTVALTAGTPSPFFTQIDSRLFLHHPLSNSVSVFKTTNQIIKIFPVGKNPQSSKIVDKTLYVFNQGSNDVTAVNIDTYDIITTIPVGLAPQGGVVVGKKIYIYNTEGNSISVLDAQTNKITKTIPVGKNPVDLLVKGGVIFVINKGDDTISLIDQSTEKVVRTMPVGREPISATFSGNILYVNNSGEKSLSLVLMANPLLTSFSSNTPDGTYSEKDSIHIQANFSQNLAPESKMTVVLDNGKEIILGKVEGNTLTGSYIVGSNDVSTDLSVKSIKSADVTGLRGLSSTEYTLPTNKNLGDNKNIKIKIDSITNTLEDIIDQQCEAKKLYRRCPIIPDPINTIQYGDNVLCEGFISGEVKKNPTISRGEVLEIAVNMMRKELSPDSEYANTYSDISSEKNADLIPLIQTALDEKLIYPNGGPFQPTKSVSRIETYALLMKGICLSPEEGLVGEEKKKAIYDLAFSTQLTTKKWNRFRPNRPVTRNEVFLLASQLADWADTNGGCDKLECRK